MSKPKPALGRNVIFHHSEDGRDYPAIITALVGFPGNPEPPKGALFLTILRPRAIAWVWATQGSGDGQFSWPIIDADDE